MAYRSSRRSSGGGKRRAPAARRSARRAPARRGASRTAQPVIKLVIEQAGQSVNRPEVTGLVAHRKGKATL